MTRKIHKRSKVSRTESTNEPRQPSRLEKKRNTHAGCPTGHGPTRGVSGVSGSTTLFHMLAQTRRELLAAVHDRRNRDQRGSRRCAAARSAGHGAGRAWTRGESSPSPRAQHRRKIVPSAGPRSRESPDVPQPTCGPHLAVMSESAPSGTGWHRANSASAATSLAPAINASSIGVARPRARVRGGVDRGGSERRRHAGRHR
jgi:hypothetical protein